MLTKKWKLTLFAYSSISTTNNLVFFNHDNQQLPYVFKFSQGVHMYFICFSCWPFSCLNICIFAILKYSSALTEHCMCVCAVLHVLLVLCHICVCVLLLYGGTV